MMQIKKASFVTSAGEGSVYPEGGIPELAIVGKSNVGKSSFINAVCNNSKLARTSQQPGKTRLINFFLINEAFYLVDLPGYGYAKASKTEKQRWGELIETYLQSGRITHLFLLLDCRHDPTEEDKIMYRYLQFYCVPYTIIATKVDKLPKYQRQQAVAQAVKKLGSIGGGIGFSAEDKSGLDEVLTSFDQIVNDVALQISAQRNCSSDV